MTSTPENLHKKASRGFRKSLLLLGIAAVAFLDFCIYWNMHLFTQSRKIGNYEKRIKVLERTNSFFPLNDRVFYELGRTYFDFGVNDLSDIGRRDRSFQRSMDYFVRSIKLNPGFYQSHFHLAQALSYQSYFSPVDVDFYEEYKKAALLTTFDSDTYYEVGKIFLTRWEELSPDNRRFSVDLLRNVLKDKRKIWEILHIWALNVGDPRVMEKLLPENFEVYRMYAQFLGERSLFLNERHEKLSQAEYMEFDRARRLFASAQENYRLFRLKKASEQFQESLRILKGIVLYQDFLKKSLIDVKSFDELEKSIYLGIVKCSIEETGDLRRARPYLNKYLELENNSSNLDEIEAYLRERKMLETGERVGSKDLESFYFRILFHFKQSRFREVIKEGESQDIPALELSSEEKKDAVKILLMIGDSYQKIDFIYDAGAYFRKALEMDPDSLEALLKMRKNYERLNEQKQIQEIDRKIEQVLQPSEMPVDKGYTGKRQKRNLSMTLDGKETEIALHFKEAGEGPLPLVTVLFNGRVVWEDYLEENILKLTLSSRVGNNLLVIIPVNREIVLEKVLRSSG